MKIEEAAIAIAVAACSMPASASLIGETVNFATAQTGSVEILAAGPASATVGDGNEFGICVGPAFDACVETGLVGGVDIQDGSIVFAFFGGTEEALGSFTVTLSGFEQTITNVTQLGGPLRRGTFGLTGFTAGTISFTGSTDSFFSGAFTDPFVFTVDTADVPEPAALGLLGLGVLGVAAARRRKAA